MRDFTLCIPTKIVFGKGKIPEIGQHARDFGKKLLLVSGKKSIKENGIYDIVIKSLQEAGLEIFEHPGVKSNPSLSHAREGIALAKKEKIDFILAVGGGSVIDEGKAISAGFYYEGDVWDFYTGSSKIKKSLPVLSILTIPATASEMNGGTVLTNDQTREKFGFLDSHLYPKLSILDPEATLSIPANYTAYSLVDAIIHLLEGYFTHEDNWVPIQDRYVESLIKTIIECGDILIKNLKDYQARATFMWAAALAWNGLSTAGVGKVSVPSHMFSHILGGQYDIAHGAALSIIVPGWMKYKYKENTGQFSKFARNVFGLQGKNDEETAIMGIEALKNWFQKIGAPVSFRQAGLPVDELEKLADGIMDLAKIWEIDGYPKEVILDILKLIL